MQKSEEIGARRRAKTKIQSGIFKKSLILSIAVVVETALGFLPFPQNSDRLILD